MKTIACLGWGSLVWDTRELALRGQWFDDGPFVQVEFARQSRDGRITLVLVPTASPVPALWAAMDTYDLAWAKSALCKREGIPAANEDAHVGAWSIGEPSPVLIPGLAEWAAARGIAHIVWTNLPPAFNGVETTPGAEEVVQYLGRLAGLQRGVAERYVRLAPRQIDTAYRRRIEAALQWSACPEVL